MLAPHSYDEASLLSQVAGGDEKAFAQLFHVYHQRLGMYLYQLTSSRTFAEENIQDIFCKVWEKRAQLPDVQHFQHWLFTVSKNHALNVIRKMVRERAEQLNWEKQQLNIPQEVELTTEERLQLLHKAISQLPPQQKKVFILSRYRQRKYVEIAKELNLSRETVKSYLQIATSSIRKYVNTHLPLFFIFLLSRLFY